MVRRRCPCFPLAPGAAGLGRTCLLVLAAAGACLLFRQVLDRRTKANLYRANAGVLLPARHLGGGKRTLPAPPAPRSQVTGAGGRHTAAGAAGTAAGATSDVAFLRRRWGVQLPNKAGGRGPGPGPKTLKMLLYAGGRDSTARVQAQLASFAGSDSDVWWVTGMPLPTNRTLDLGAAAESGGYRDLPRKTIALFRHVANSADLNAYGFYMKADDDTYINTPRLRLLLSQLNPDIPLYLGSARFGFEAGRSAHVALGQLVRKGEYFREYKHYTMCHGGSGYILSRAMVRLLKDHLRVCEYEPPPTKLEDARLAFCINRWVGMKCNGLEKGLGFDILRNKRSSKKLDAWTRSMAAQQPAGFASGVTFHQANPELQAFVHATLRELRGNARVTATVRQKTTHWLNYHPRAFVSTWNCTVAHKKAGDGAEAAVQPMSCVCQGNAAKATQATENIRVHGGSTWVRPNVAGRQRRNGSASHQRRVVMLMEETGLGGGGGGDGGSTATLTTTPSTAGQAAQVVRLAASLGAASGRSAPEALRDSALLLFVRDTSDAAWRTLPPAVRLVQINPATLLAAATARGKGAPGADADGYARLLVFGGYLLDHTELASATVLHAPLTAHFQRDPFASIDHRGGVALFVTEKPNPYLTKWPPRAGLVARIFGVCSQAEARAPPTWVGPAVLDTAFAIGRGSAYAQAVAAVAHEYATTYAGASTSNANTTANGGVKRGAARGVGGCSVPQAFSRAVWSGKVAELVPVTVYTHSDTPVVRRAVAGGGGGTGPNDDSGVTRNSRGDAAAVVL